MACANGSAPRVPKVVMLSGCQSRHEQLATSASRAARKDLDDAGSKADQHADLPSAVIGTGEVEDQPAAPSTQGRSDLMHDEGGAEQGR